MQQAAERPQHRRREHHRPRNDYRNEPRPEHYSAPRVEQPRVEMNPNANHAEIPLPSSVIPEIPQANG